MPWKGNDQKYGRRWYESYDRNTQKERKATMNILAVDDEYYALELMKRALEEVAVGATVYLCRDVKSALQTATEQKIDAAFLDIHMPEMNGVDLARELKLLNPKVNIVFATGFSDIFTDTYPSLYSRSVRLPK